MALSHLIVSFILCVLLLSACRSQGAGVQAVPVVEGLQHPWSMVFLPDGEILVSERAGELRRIQQGQLLEESVQGLPDMYEHGQGGLLGLALHPEFIANRWLYFAYTPETEDGYSTHLARGRYQDGVLDDVEVLFQAQPAGDSTRHFGGRIAFDQAGYVYLSLGDRGERDLAQQLNNHAGSMIRLHDDGSVPNDNPFVGIAGQQPEIYSYGHRNIQGLAIHPDTDAVWTHEHGPQGGDELNLIQAGANYGWPIVTYGKEYGGDTIGDGLTQQDGMQQPVTYWTPSIAPSGMTFYNGDKYPAWNGGVFVGALKAQSLVFLKIQHDQVVQESYLLEKVIGRIRDVQQGLDGYLYVLTDTENAALYRVE